LLSTSRNRWKFAREHKQKKEYHRMLSSRVPTLCGKSRNVMLKLEDCNQGFLLSRPLRVGLAPRESRVPEYRILPVGNPWQYPLCDSRGCESACWPRTTSVIEESTHWGLLIKGDAISKRFSVLQRNGKVKSVGFLLYKSERSINKKSSTRTL
jgi:hypothetical protein